MAFSNTFDTTNTGSAVSNREDLTDVLTILAPEETPILSSANKERASATNVEWTVDSLSAPQTGGISEGADVSAFTDKFASRARLGNRIQKFRRDYMVSNREDLTDVLTILAPEETPILSSANKERASATNVEWTVDSLSAPQTGGISEGADVSAFTDKFASRARLGNRIQKFRRDYMVSDLQEAVDSVGPAKIAQAEAKAIRELKRDIEATLAGTQDKATEDGAGTANALRGLGDFLDSAGPADVPAAYRTPADSIYTTTEANAAEFSESKLNDIISSILRS